MNRCLVSLGANIGNPAHAITTAAAKLREQFGASPNEFRLSRLYKTPPVGGPAGQPPFVNAVAAIETRHDPWSAWQIVREIEAEMGRVRQRRWEARKIDLDVLLHDEHCIWTPHFKVPHPRMCMRRFILAPAAEVAADWLEPVSGQSIGSLADRLAQGPASLLLVADNSLRAGTLLQEAARQALARWRFAELDERSGYRFTEAASGLSRHSGVVTGLDDPVDANPPGQSRWVSLIETPQPFSVAPRRASIAGRPSIKSGPKLTVYMPPAMPDTDAAWEDYSREWAKFLGMKSSSGNGAGPRPSETETPQVGMTRPTGARYLLPADDREWAVHELVAALEAMDCPIEPIV